MPQIIKPALRNVRRSPGRSGLVLVLQALMVALFFIGNSILAESNDGLRRSYTMSYTADAFIHTAEDIDISLFGATTPSVEDLHSLREIPDFAGIRSSIRDNPVVESTLPLLSGIAELQVASSRTNTVLFGIDPKQHFAFFPGIRLTEPLDWSGNDRGIAIPDSKAERISRVIGTELRIGDPMLLTSYHNGDFRIREVPLRAVYSIDNPAIDDVAPCFVDAATLRELLRVSRDSESDSPSSADSESDSASLMDFEFDSLFDESGGLETFISDDSGDGMSVEAISGLIDSKDSTGETRGGRTAIEDGEWHFLLIRFVDGVSSKPAIRRIRDDLDGTNLEIGGWQAAAGLTAILVVLLQVVFNGGFLLVVIAGIVAVVNLLTISMTERTGEIGTLRALGGKRSFVFRMLLFESLVVSFIASLLGVGLSSLGLIVLNTSELVLNNHLLKSLFGNTRLVVAFSPSIAAVSIGIGILLGFISSLFPISIAMKISPLEAMRRE